MVVLPDIIRKKRDGYELTDEEMQFFVESSCNGKADSSQIGAMLMAMFKSKLSSKETAALTSKMVKSGLTLQWPGIVVDKHSTGGVGDKVSIPLVPALAALGFTIPMISGRGLGWTGGTLDKLESIPGFKTELSPADMQNILGKCSCFIAATTQSICPADKMLYKIRDVTATVEDTNLVTASILSKKIAAGVKNLVLDIKVGKGTFMTNMADAEKVAETMISVAKAFKMNIRCIISEMDNPIGMTIGNSLEIEESIDTLLKKGPKDLLELVTHLGGELLVMTGKVENVAKGKEKIQQVIDDGSALNSFTQMLLCQGVSPDVVSKLSKGDYSDLPKSKHKTILKSKAKGYISSIDGLEIAKATWSLGAGRSKPEETIDHSVGIRLHKTIGDSIDIEEPIMTIYHNKPLASTMSDNLISSVKLSNDKISPSSKVIKCFK